MDDSNEENPKTDFGLHLEQGLKRAQEQAQKVGRKANNQNTKALVDEAGSEDEAGSKDEAGSEYEAGHIPYTPKSALNMFNKTGGKRRKTRRGKRSRKTKKRKQKKAKQSRRRRRVR